MKTQQIVLASRPEGTPGYNDFRFEATELSPLQEGEVRLKPLYISVDPYLRGRMKDEPSYIPPFELNKPIASAVIAQVAASKSPGLQTGDKVVGLLPWATDMQEAAANLMKLDPAGLPDSYFLGTLGYPGYTAYLGIKDICQPKPGETVVVSGAAGAVGTIAGQIAKIMGARVVGIAGTDEKAALLKNEFGFDEVINYKTAKDLSQAIAAACPKGVDAYFDNVGGDITDAVIRNINFHGRIALCGQISLYNDAELSTGPRILYTVLMRSILIKGYVVSDYADRFPEAIAALSGWVKEGKLKVQETIAEGFEKLPEAFLGLFTGNNTGKMLVKI